jgi:hypothetical protein
MIGRREFITLLGGAGAAWPLAARAQQPQRMRRLGVLMSSAESDPEAQARVAVLLQGLRQLGWIEGRNVRVDFRWGEGSADNMRKHAAELAALAPDIPAKVTVRFSVWRMAEGSSGALHVTGGDQDRRARDRAYCAHPCPAADELPGRRLVPNLPAEPPSARRRPAAA